MDSYRQSDCGCRHDDDRFMNSSVDELPLAMAYIPWQQWRSVLCADKALACGTIFEELIMPFQHAAINCGPCERRGDRR